MTDAGWRTLPHTADVMIEAWGPTRDRCLEEAARALIATFADVAGARAADRAHATLDADDADERLIELLEEVLYTVEVHGLVPVTIAVDDRDVSFGVAPIADVTAAGAVPKAVTRHALSIGEEDGRWTCRATIDV